jgi:hypothetical protein
MDAKLESGGCLMLDFDEGSPKARLTSDGWAGILLGFRERRI